MPAPEISNEAIVEILFKQVSGIELGAVEQLNLYKWLKLSSYNKSVFDDISNREDLKQKLKDVNPADHSRFWNIVINYRTALHTGIPEPKGNFWKRWRRRIQRAFGLRKTP